MLDLGCGHGLDALHFSSLSHHVLAVDHSCKMLRRAKGNAPRALLLNADLRRLGGALVAGSLDGVWAAGSVGELPRREAGAVLRDLRDKVRAGGVLYLSLPGAAAAPGGEAFAADERYAGDGRGGAPLCDSRRRHEARYTAGEATALVAAGGWEVLRASGERATPSLVFVFATRRPEGEPATA